jgi:hypothetical protein
MLKLLTLTKIILKVEVLTITEKLFFIKATFSKCQPRQIYFCLDYYLGDSYILGSIGSLSSAKNPNTHLSTDVPTIKTVEFNRNLSFPAQVFFRGILQNIDCSHGLPFERLFFPHVIVCLTVILRIYESTEFVN